ncbi:multicopper oxidase family protein [Xanthobacter sp. DSM 24535]|uniref:multicopper oxidase family protein n=1 Tax=Roseixanthobacter psychrophilus TaxID=3119917 RepID=UPI003728F8FE
MRVSAPSRRAVLSGAAALAFSAPFARTSFAQAPASVPTPQDTANRLKAANTVRIELGGQTPMPLFGESIPGPLLRVKRGAPFAVNVENAIGAPLSLHWQGVRLPNALDGVPGLTGTAIAPGEKRDIAFTPPDAGTFLYRAFVPEQAARSLVGAFVVEEPGASPFSTDLTLLVQAWSPDPTMKVPLLTVNGAVSPTLEAPAGGRARLRLVNASSRFLRLKLGDAPCFVLAIDGQPVQPFALKDGITQLTPGGRIDIALDVGTADPIRLDVETSALPVQLALVVPVGPGSSPQGQSLPAPEALPSNGLPEKIPLEAAARFNVSISGTGSLTAFPSLGSVKVGQSVVLSLANTQDTPVAVLLHGAPARILDGMDDGWKPWWHDAIPVAPRSTVRAALVPSATGKWALIGQRGGDGAIVSAHSYDVT